MKYAESGTAIRQQADQSWAALREPVCHGQPRGRLQDIGPSGVGESDETYWAIGLIVFGQKKPEQRLPDLELVTFS